MFIEFAIHKKSELIGTVYAASFSKNKTKMLEQTIIS